MTSEVILDKATMTTVMLPTEAVYATKNGEYQQIKIITISGWP
jgi:hypothetical protein